MEHGNVYPHPPLGSDITCHRGHAWATRERTPVRRPRASLITRNTHMSNINWFRPALSSSGERLQLPTSLCGQDEKNPTHIFRVVRTSQTCQYAIRSA
ncbi:hypothetical protein PanWU01x14_254390 [Parasponia andersonii]|uniref:Uncharacterized protein n=1 Tax=Parasponia andersonii TaxID=3476 RepID=A0A2P5BB50_PARAD|nr:hypothetical protein PanWU01x14_254390 [Parasponia andersonii]